MRAVFLGGGGSRRESAGTGVFLPRRPGTPTDLRKKPGLTFEYFIGYAIRHCHASLLFKVLIVSLVHGFLDYSLFDGAGAGESRSSSESES